MQNWLAILVDGINRVKNSASASSMRIFPISSSFKSKTTHVFPKYQDYLLKPSFGCRRFVRLFNAFSFSKKSPCKILNHSSVVPHRLWLTEGHDCIIVNILNALGVFTKVIQLISIESEYLCIYPWSIINVDLFNDKSFWQTTQTVCCFFVFQFALAPLTAPLSRVHRIWSDICEMHSLLLFISFMFSRFFYFQPLLPPFGNVCNAEYYIQLFYRDKSE